METETHRQTVGDGLGLIDVARAGAAHVQFLQTDDVRFVLGDHRGDAIDVQPPIDADAAVHIVGDQTGHGRLALS